MLTRRLLVSSTATSKVAAVTSSSSSRFSLNLLLSIGKVQSASSSSSLFLKNTLLLRNIGTIAEQGSRPANQPSDKNVSEELSAEKQNEELATNLAELEQQQGNSDNQDAGEFGSNDEVSTELEADEEGASFDVVEATLQEVHDLLVAMMAHQNNTVLRENYKEGGHYRLQFNQEKYLRYQDWEAGHKLFDEWTDKLEQLLTPEIMKAMIRNAEYNDRHPSQVANSKIVADNNNSSNNNEEADGDEKSSYQELVSNPDNFQGFSRHPLSYSAATGSQWKNPQPLPGHFNIELPTPRQSSSGHRTPVVTDALRTKQRLTRGAAQFFTHGPYQMQISRPDASAALMDQTRSHRDLDSMHCLKNLTQEGRIRARQMPRQDRLRLINIVSKAMESIE